MTCQASVEDTNENETESAPLKCLQASVSGTDT